MTVYIAAPFFTDKCNAVLDVVEQKFKDNEISYFSPRKEGGVLNDMSEKKRRKNLLPVFMSNIAGITNSDLLLAVVDRVDTGTTWEMGCAFGYWLVRCNAASNITASSSKIDVPIVTFSYTYQEANLMIAQSTGTHLLGTEDLDAFIKCYDQCAKKLDYSTEYHLWRKTIQVFNIHKNIRDESTGLETSE